MKVVAENWEESVAVQRELERRGFQLINSRQSLEMKTFVIVFPPCGCCRSKGTPSHRFPCQECLVYETNEGCPIHDKKDKPVICSDSGTETGEIYESAKDTLRFLDMVDYMASLTISYELSKQFNHLV